MNDEPTITSEQASTWAADNKSIYGPVGTRDETRIADLGAAQEMATKEEEAQKLENKLQGEALAEMKPLKPEQQSNVEVVKGMAERHPGVFEYSVEDGMPFWTINSPSNNEDKIFFSADGVYNVKKEGLGGGLDGLSLQKMSRYIESGARRILSGDVLPGSEFSTMGFQINALKLDPQGDKDRIKNSIAASEKFVNDERLGIVESKLKTLGDI